MARTADGGAVVAIVLLVAGVASLASPMAAGLGLAAAALCAGRMMLRLPYAAPEHGGERARVPGAWRMVAVMVGDGRLRRTLYLTMLVAFSMAALPITALHMGAEPHIPAAGAVVLTAAYGIGNLSGSVGVMLCPIQGSPDRLPLKSGRAASTLLTTAISGRSARGRLSIA